MVWGLTVLPIIQASPEFLYVSEVADLTDHTRREVAIYPSSKSLFYLLPSTTRFYSLLHLNPKP